MGFWLGSSGSGALECLGLSVVGLFGEGDGVPFTLFRMDRIRAEVVITGGIGQV